MEYRIDMTDSAFADAEKSVIYYKKDSIEVADLWLKGLVEAINSLKTFPNRCPIIPETRSFFIEFRQLLYGKGNKQHRILFSVSIDEKNF